MTLHKVASVPEFKFNLISVLRAFHKDFRNNTVQDECNYSRGRMDLLHTVNAEFKVEGLETYEGIFKAATKYFKHGRALALIVINKQVWYKRPGRSGTKVLRESAPRFQDFVDDKMIAPSFCDI